MTFGRIEATIQAAICLPATPFTQITATETSNNRMASAFPSRDYDIGHQQVRLPRGMRRHHDRCFVPSSAPMSGAYVQSGCFRQNDSS